MDSIVNFFKRPFVRRIFVLLLVVLVIFLLRSEITLFLLTFIFIYIVNTGQKLISRQVERFFKVNRLFVVAFLYLVVVAVLFALIYIYAPKIVMQVVEIIKSISQFITTVSTGQKTNNILLDYLIGLTKKIDIQKYVQDGGVFLLSLLKQLGTLSITILGALILSLFFMLEKGKIRACMTKFQDSKIRWIYDDIRYFGKKFVKTFGKVIQAQILIALINSVLSVIALSIMQFPNLFGLWLMIFMLGLIPVAGVFISLVPLSIIAYSVGGLNYIIYVLVLIAILHALESYVLNPKLMSHSTKLPVFFTLLILIVSEHFFGIWGLIVGIPITMFLLDLLGVKTGSD